MVTGASGFVGQWVCRRLRQAGVPVVRALRAPPAGRDDVVIGNLGPDTALESALKGVRTVVHLAAHVHRMRADASDARRFEEVNVAGTLALARQAARAGVERLVFLSSIKIHGECTADGECWTEDSPPAPADDYARSKWQAEQQLQTLAREQGLAVTTLRPPLVYGPGVGANFRALLGLARSGLPLPLASIRNRRSLIYVENLADAVFHMLGETAPGYRAYVISDGEDLSTPGLLARLRAGFGRPPRLLPVPVSALAVAARLAGRAGQWRRLSESLCVDARRIGIETGWRAPVTLSAALQRTCDWYLESRRKRD